MGEPAVAERGGWGGQLEFILTLVGFAVGLGNVWRFPYLAYSNGGGAFLIPYLLTLALIGIPLFFLEISLGQFASRSQIKIWNISPIFKGIGFAAVMVATMICFYYNIIIAWCLYYFFASMTDTLPWTTCGNSWNTEFCLEKVNTTANVSANATTNVTFVTPAEEYFYRYVLQMSDSIDDMGTIRWQLACLLGLSWVIVFLVLLKGVESLGKVSYFVSIFPYVLLTIMLVRGATLEGASKGIEFYMNPDFSRLGDLKVWSDAATQIFYSLGVAMGGLIAMSSYNKFNNNTLRDAIMIPLINCGTSIYAGFVIFSVLGYMANEKGSDIRDVATDGPGLVFVVYPEGLATMPVAPLWSVLFFLMMIMLGFSSQFSTAEGVVSAFLDEFPSLQRGKIPLMMRAGFCTICFLLGLPMCTQGGFYLFNIFNDYSASYSLFAVGALEMIIIGWIYGFNRFSEDFSLMLGRPVPIYFRICIQFAAPIIITALVILKITDQTAPSYNGVPYPAWAQGVAWTIAILPMVFILIFMITVPMSRGGWQVVKKSAKPMPAWGPASAENRTGRYALPAGGARGAENGGLNHRSPASIELTAGDRGANRTVNGYSNHAFTGAVRGSLVDEGVNPAGYGVYQDLQPPPSAPINDGASTSSSER